MKVLYLVSWYRRPGSPNSGYFFYQLAKGMSKKVDEVIVLNIHIKFFAIIDKIGIVENHSDNLHEFTAFVPALIPRWKWLYDKIGRLVSKIMIRKLEIRYGRFDIIHVQSALMAASYSERYLITSGIPVVYTEHSSKVLNGNLNQYEKKALRVMDECSYARFAVSRLLAQKLEEYVKNVDVIGNIVDLEAANGNHQIKKDNKFTFLCLGTLRKDKGMVELIRAFGEEFSTGENVRLVIGGEGEYRSKIEEEAKRYPSHDIKIIGIVPHEKVGEILRNCDCFVLASKYETFGIVYIEAMSCGVPVIATKCGGPQEFVNKTNGILVDVDDEKQLRIALREMTIRINDFDKDSISQNISKKYSSEAICTKYYEVYKRAANEA